MTYPYFYAGGFGCYYGRDSSGQMLVLICERGKVFAGLSEGYGVPGGYVEAARREPLIDAAVRELREELRLPDGAPLLPDVTMENLALFDSGIDYRTDKADPRYAGIAWHAYRCELSTAEIESLKAHIRAMHDDPLYACNVRQACHDEVENILLLSPQELLNQLRSSFHFAYAHEAKAVRQLAEQLFTDIYKQQRYQIFL